MRIIFIRHGKTAGNLEKRYIGRTDEPLCCEGKNELRLRSYPAADIVIASPMKRCTETAELIYPDKNIVICDDLRECDFGDFEGKNYTELSENADYQRWIDSGGKTAFPNGEDNESFKKRCILAFEKAAADNIVRSTAFVVHGGTIMAILEKYAYPKRDFYDFQVKNGCGYITEYNGENIRIIGEIK